MADMKKITIDKDEFDSGGYKTRIDPLTHEHLKVGDEIVICGDCGAAILIDSWITLDEKCTCKYIKKIDLRRTPETTTQTSEVKQFYENNKDFIWLVSVVAFVVILVLAAN